LPKKAQTLGGIIHSIEKRMQHWLSKEKKPVAVTSEQMAKDLRAMNDAVSRTTDLLDGATKDQFRETSARYLETLAMPVSKRPHGRAARLPRPLKRFGCSWKRPASPCRRR